VKGWSGFIILGPGGAQQTPALHSLIAWTHCKGIRPAQPVAAHLNVVLCALRHAALHWASCSRPCSCVHADASRVPAWDEVVKALNVLTLRLAFAEAMARLPRVPFGPSSPVKEGGLGSAAVAHGSLLKQAI
jgi:hypothetical protein